MTLEMFQAGERPLARPTDMRPRFFALRWGEIARTLGVRGNPFGKYELAPIITNTSTFKGGIFKQTDASQGRIRPSGIWELWEQHIPFSPPFIPPSVPGAVEEVAAGMM